MAFLTANLALIGNAGSSDAPRLWGYKTDDAHAAVDSAGYFNGASDRLKPGDLIDVVVLSSAIGADPEVVTTYGRHIVLTNASGVVDVSDVTVGTVTDTD